MTNQEYMRYCIQKRNLVARVVVLEPQVKPRYPIYSHVDGKTTELHTRIITFEQCVRLGQYLFKKLGISGYISFKRGARAKTRFGSIRKRGCLYRVIINQPSVGIVLHELAHITNDGRVVWHTWEFFQREKQNLAWYNEISLNLDRI